MQDNSVKYAQRSCDREESQLERTDSKTSHLFFPAGAGGRFCLPRDHCWHLTRSFYIKIDRSGELLAAMCAEEQMASAVPPSMERFYGRIQNRLGTRDCNKNKTKASPDALDGCEGCQTKREDVEKDSEVVCRWKKEEQDGRIEAFQIPAMEDSQT